MSTEFAQPRSHSRGLMMLAGALATLAGVVSIAVPAIAAVATSVFIGIILLCAAFPLAFEGFAGGHHLGGALLRLVIAAVTMLAGVYLLVAPLKGSYTLTVILVIWFVAVGFARIAGGLASLGVRAPNAWLNVLNGVVSLALGILIAEELPSSADWAIGLLVGIDLIFFGVATLWVAFGLDRRAGEIGPAPVL